MAGDRIWLGSAKNNIRTYGFVKYVSSNEIVMKLQTAKPLEQQPLYSIHFEINRLTFKLQRLALDTAKRLDIIDLLFPQSSQKKLLTTPTIPK